MDYEKLINCLERKTADTHELQAASAIIGLRQRVQELEKDCDEYHQVAMNHIHANEKLTAERDALKQQRDELLAALEEAIDAVRVFHGPVDWETYRDHSPEMKRWQAAIASVKEK